MKEMEMNLEKTRKRLRREDVEMDRLSDLPYPGYFSCETLKSLKLHPGTIKEIPIPFDFTSLTTLQLFRVDSSYISPTYEVFPGCVNLENLQIIECNFSNLWLLQIDAPSLVDLTIIDLEFEGILGIAAAKLKYLYYSGNCPAMWEIDECPALEKVDVITHEVQEQFDMIRWAQKILHAKSVAISFDTCDGEQFKLSKMSSRGRN